jgi:hypothetical protein
MFSQAAAVAAATNLLHQGGAPATDYGRPPRHRQADSLAYRRSFVSRVEL